MIVGNQVWCEDDATTRDPDFESIEKWWQNLFGEPLDTKKAVERVGEDTDEEYCLMPNGMIVCMSYPGNCAVYTQGVALGVARNPSASLSSPSDRGSDFSLIWDADASQHPAYEHFVKEMAGRAYGPEPINSAWGWFRSGWDARGQ